MQAHINYRGYRGYRSYKANIISDVVSKLDELTDLLTSDKRYKKSRIIQLVSKILMQLTDIIDKKNKSINANLSKALSGSPIEKRLVEALKRVGLAKEEISQSMASGDIRKFEFQAGKAMAALAGVALIFATIDAIHRHLKKRKRVLDEAVQLELQSERMQEIFDEFFSEFNGFPDKDENPEEFAKQDPETISLYERSRESKLRSVDFFLSTSKELMTEIVTEFVGVPEIQEAFPDLYKTLHRDAALTYNKALEAKKAIASGEDMGHISQLIDEHDELHSKVVVNLNIILDAFEEYDDTPMEVPSI